MEKSLKAELIVDPDGLYEQAGVRHEAAIDKWMKATQARLADHPNESWESLKEAERLARHQVDLAFIDWEFHMRMMVHGRYMRKPKPWYHRLWWTRFFSKTTRESVFEVW